MKKKSLRLLEKIQEYGSDLHHYSKTIEEYEYSEIAKICLENQKLLLHCIHYHIIGCACFYRDTNEKEDFTKFVKETMMVPIMEMIDSFQPEQLLMSYFEEESKIIDFNKHKKGNKNDNN